MKLSRSTWLSILLGVAYGVTLRLLMAVPNLEFSGLVSISFFVIVPIATGFIVVFFGIGVLAFTMDRSSSISWSAA